MVSVGLAPRASPSATPSATASTKRFCSVCESCSQQHVVYASVHSPREALTTTCVAPILVARPAVKIQTKRSRTSLLRQPERSGQSRLRHVRVPARGGVWHTAPRADSSGDDVQSHQDRVEERRRDKSQDRRAAKRPKFSSDDPSTWKVSDMWWV